MRTTSNIITKYRLVFNYKINYHLPSFKLKSILMFSTRCFCRITNTICLHFIKSRLVSINNLVLISFCGKCLYYHNASIDSIDTPTARTSGTRTRVTQMLSNTFVEICSTPLTTVPRRLNRLVWEVAVYAHRITRYRVPGVFWKNFEICSSN